MAKDIQIKYINESQQWEELFPITKTRLVKNDAGETINILLNNKYNKNETYSSVEIDSKVTTLNDKIDTVSGFDIPVSATEPTDSNLWFEVK